MGENPKWGKTQQPLLDRFHSKSKSNKINPSTSASLTKNTTLDAIVAPYKGNAPPQGAPHKREIPEIEQE